MVGTADQMNHDLVWTHVLKWYEVNQLQLMASDLAGYTEQLFLT